MKNYRLISIKFGNGIINFFEGIVELDTKGKMEILVEKNVRNLEALLEAGVTFVTIEKSYRFYVAWDNIFDLWR